MESMPDPNEWMARVEWLVPKEQPADSVYVRWHLDGEPLLGHRVMKMVHQHYFKGFGRTIHVFWNGQPLLRRSTDNDRDESSSREQYRAQFRERGYHASGRSSPVYQTVPVQAAWVPGLPEPQTCKLMLGGATTSEAIMEECEANPSNPNCSVIICEGIRNCDEVAYDAPLDIVTFVVTDYNVWQSGSGFNSQQLIHITEEYHQSWAKEMENNKWTTRSFGKGELSRDVMMWNHLQRTYQQDLRFEKRTHFEKCSGLIYQVKQLKLRTDHTNVTVMDAILALLKDRVDHQYKGFMPMIMLLNMHAVENAIRNTCQTLSKEMRARLTYVALMFCLPFKEKNRSWRSLSLANPRGHC